MDPKPQEGSRWCKTLGGADGYGLTVREGLLMKKAWFTKWIWEGKVDRRQNREQWGGIMEGEKEGGKERQWKGTMDEEKEERETEWGRQDR